MNVSVTIKNKGSYTGDEVVQLYVRNNASKQQQPIKALKEFKRINLRKGEAKTVEMSFTAEDLRTFYEDKNKFEVDAGTYEIQIGVSSRDIRLKTQLIVN